MGAQMMFNIAHYDNYMLLLTFLPFVLFRAHDMNSLLIDLYELNLCSECKTSPVQLRYAMITYCFYGTLMTILCALFVNLSNQIDEVSYLPLYLHTYNRT
jgi:hypothetical protein